jgi:membrane-bound lytic murein transglycosylase D
VGKGDTLSLISSRYHSAPEAIMRMNALKSARALKLNSELIVPVPSARALAAGKADPFIERQSAQARRAGVVVRPEEEIPAGTQSSKATLASGTVKTEAVAGKTRVVYGVASGDTLWSISQRFDVSLGALREWNEALPPKGRSLKVGTPLTIWPGPKAELAAKAP